MIDLRKSLADWQGGLAAGVTRHREAIRNANEQRVMTRPARPEGRGGDQRENMPAWESHQVRGRRNQGVLVLEFLSIFIYPFVFLIVTPVVILMVGTRNAGRPRDAVRPGIAAAALLTVTLGPTIADTGAGSVLIPWWLPMKETRHFYVWQFAAACSVAIVALAAALGAFRSFVTRARRR